MKTLGFLAGAFFFAIVMLVTVALFGTAFNNVPHGGAYAVAGAIMVAAGMLSMAIVSRGGGP
jgi:hypothetical protein